MGGEGAFGRIFDGVGEPSKRADFWAKMLGWQALVAPADFAAGSFS